jgi:hypothetical protein
MPDQSSPPEFEDVPLEQARRMGRRPRMEPLLYDTLKTKIQALSDDAVQENHGDVQLDISDEEAADAQVNGRAARHACRRRR